MRALLLLTLLNFSDVKAPRSWLSCASGRFCGPADRRIFAEKQAKAMKVVGFLNDYWHRQNQVMDENSTDPPLLAEEIQEALQARDYLCHDAHVGGFLLAKDAKNWPLACLNLGSEWNSTCAPAPPDLPYMTRERWASQLQTAELYICRHRCMNNGLTYFQVLLSVASVFCAFVMSIVKT